MRNLGKIGKKRCLTFWPPYKLMGVNGRDKDDLYLVCKNFMNWFKIDHLSMVDQQYV